jgi:hypothetical protein
MKVKPFLASIGDGPFSHQYQSLIDERDVKQARNDFAKNKVKGHGQIYRLADIGFTPYSKQS